MTDCGSGSFAISAAKIDPRMKAIATVSMYNMGNANRHGLHMSLTLDSPRPMLFITGSEAHSREFSEDAYARAAEPKQLIVVPGAGHVDLYDRTDLIPFDSLIKFFKANF